MRGNRLAKVVGVHPESYAVDLLFLDDGSQVPMVQVLGDMCSTNTGNNDMVEPDLAEPAKKYSSKESKTRDIYAMVGYAGPVPIVMGFLFPQVCAMLFKDMKNFRVDRHASDVYSTLDNDGNLEWAHPSGTFFRIAVDPTHKDLTGLDYDKKWKIGTANKTKHVHVYLELQKEGVQKATVDIDPDGNVTLTNAGTFTSTTQGNVKFESVNGTITLKAKSDIAVQTTNGNITETAQSGTVTVDTPTVHMTGDLNVDKTMTATTDAIGGGKHLKTHTHGGVTVGSGTSGAPT